MHILTKAMKTRSHCRRAVPCLFESYCKQNRKFAKRHSSSGQNFIVKSPFIVQDIPSVSIPEFVWSRLEKWPEHTAVVCSQSGQSYKYKDLRNACREFGAGILSQLPTGSTVGLIMPNCPDYFVTLLGCVEAGFIVSPMNPTYGPVEIKHQVVDSGAKLVIAHPSKAADVKAAVPDIPLLTVGDGSSTLDEVRARGKGKDLPPIPDPESIAILPYSSGTTGLPKGVMLTHSNIVSNVLQFDHPKTRMPNEATSDFQEINPCVLPFFHIYGFTVGMVLYLYKGARTVAIPKFEPQSFIDVLNKHKPTLMHLVPPLIQFLAQHPGVTKESLAHVRIASNGAAPMSPAYAEKLLSKKDLILISGYGLTESSPAIASCPSDKTDMFSLGFPVSNSDVKIVNLETGEAQDPSIEGEVCSRGPQIMKGYHNNEEATNSTIKDGWLHTGDIGYISKKDGRLYLVDRLKELIKVKGFQVAPVELERVLVTHASVADTGVVGMPDERSGETPVAFVVKKPDTQITEKDIISFLSSKVSAPHKRVSKVIFVESIPRNASGKILRRVLKQMIN